MIWSSLSSCFNFVFHILQEVGAQLQVHVEDPLSLNTSTKVLTNLKNHPNIDGLENQREESGFTCAARVASHPSAQADF